ncbi:hypothetical protein KUCAC02_009767 [Chaenocephalus aceratus]|uniref:Uncharacterized protein n=1 Tax=Chaenocephalus aceratus TaxID=36190 RepID=A0ACB9VXH9_CHAAC|nr:hypothetical protein KUCAC02_009767 [Chaenocephalus aceratus]
MLPPLAAGAGAALSRSSLAVPPSTAQGFLSKLSRSKRNLWDRSRPDVQQWIQQLMYMGFDEQRLETDLSYWMDQSRSRDQGRQHHYDENAPIEPGTTAPTDTEPMSTTTTINCDMKLSITKFSTAAFDKLNSRHATDKRSKASSEKAVR